MAAPAHFFRLEVVDLIAGRDGGMGILMGGELTFGDQRMRGQRSRPRGGGERDAACRKSKGEFQKVPAFHDISSSALDSNRETSFTASR
jgi:hypothetical protein